MKFSHQLSLGPDGGLHYLWAVMRIGSSWNTCSVRKRPVVAGSWWEAAPFGNCSESRVFTSDVYRPSRNTCSVWKRVVGGSWRGTALFGNFSENHFFTPDIHHLSWNTCTVRRRPVVAGPWLSNALFGNCSENRVFTFVVYRPHETHAQSEDKLFQGQQHNLTVTRNLQVMFCLAYGLPVLPVLLHCTSLHCTLPVLPDLSLLHNCNVKLKFTYLKIYFIVSQNCV